MLPLDVTGLEAMARQPSVVKIYSQYHNAQVRNEHEKGGRKVALNGSTHDLTLLALQYQQGAILPFDRLKLRG